MTLANHWTEAPQSFILRGEMSARLSPLAVPVAPLEEETAPEEPPRLTRQMVESLEAPMSNRAELAWAEEVAGQVAALWEGRGDGRSFQQALADVQSALATARERIA